MAGHDERPSGGLEAEGIAARRRTRAAACLTLCMTLVGVVTLHRWQGYAVSGVEGSPVAREWTLCTPQCAASLWTFEAQIRGSLSRRERQLGSRSTATPGAIPPSSPFPLLTKHLHPI